MSSDSDSDTTMPFDFYADCKLKFQNCNFQLIENFNMNENIIYGSNDLKEVEQIFKDLVGWKSGYLEHGRRKAWKEMKTIYKHVVCENVTYILKVI